MVERKDLRQVRPYVYEIDRQYRHDMRVPARFYADELILEQVLGDQSLGQLVNVSTLPGVTKHVLAMPDIHQGYGSPIGGVAAMSVTDGIISPGMVGYDINCGVRLLASHIDRPMVAPYLANLASELYRQVPSGVGEKGFINLSYEELDDVLRHGSQWALKKGYARQEDLAHTEERGTMAGADPAQCSRRAKERGKTQLGTLGAGNHFAEVDEVAEIFDAEAAQAMGLFPGQVVVQIHCGSRGFGHQVCTDYVDSFQKVVHRYGIVLPDRQLVCAPFDSAEGRAYYAAMCAAANYAFANRQVLTHQIRGAFQTVLAGKVKNHSLFQVYDIAHNMAKVEFHTVDDQRLKLCVHRKGATRAFGPDSEVLPAGYRSIGQPVLVPGSMGTASYVLVGTAGSMAQTFGSTCHGAGRVLSRAAAKRQVHGGELRNHLQARGIEVRAGSLAGLAEEAPTAYKDVDHVVEVVHNAGIARKVARLAPLAVVKG